MNDIKADFAIDERTTYPFAISDGTNPQMLIKIAGESPQPWQTNLFGQP